jgi:hypothetical protein
MSAKTNAWVIDLYRSFRAPITELDCGMKCSPYNENNVPFCCDPSHAIPTALPGEWEYLQASTDQWSRLPLSGSPITEELSSQVPDGQTLITCSGHVHCKREFRSLTCRSFPFFPYIDSTGKFIGLTVYWEYEDRCWVISNLKAVTSDYRAEFISAYDDLFQHLPAEYENFRGFSALMRRTFIQRRRTIRLLHRDGKAYYVNPNTGRYRSVQIDQFPKYGVYKLVLTIPFPDELDQL